MIDSQRVVCLNEADNHTIRDLLKGGGDKWLESDADEQLLLHIPVRRCSLVVAKLVRSCLALTADQRWHQSSRSQVHYCTLCICSSSQDCSPVRQLDEHARLRRCRVARACTGTCSHRSSGQGRGKRSAAFRALPERYEFVGELPVSRRWRRQRETDGPVRVQIFIAGNQGGEDVTRLDKLEIWGQSIDGTDMSALSKGEHDHEH